MNRLRYSIGPEGRNYFLFYFVQPVFKQPQNFWFGHRFKLFGLEDLIHQALAHVRWIDTFVHALCQSKVNQTGHFVIAGISDQIHHKAYP